MQSNLGIYLAEIVTPANPRQLRTQVRVLPFMKGISNTEELPWFPPFFKTQAILARAGELVWVVTNEQFTLGYVMGFVSSITWFSDYDTQSVQQDFLNQIDSALVSLEGQLFNFNNTIITYWDNNSIHFIDRSTSAVTIAFKTGVIHRVASEGIAIRCGRSKFKITADSITLDSEKIQLSGNVRLGLNPVGHIAVMANRSGTNSIPCPSVMA